MSRGRIHLIDFIADAIRAYGIWAEELYRAEDIPGLTSKAVRWRIAPGRNGITPQQRRQFARAARSLHAGGKTWAQCGDVLGISQHTLRAWTRATPI